MKKKYFVSLVVLILIVLSLGFFFYIQSTKNDLQTHTGVVTSKFTDCAGGEEMDRDGNISEIQPPFLCDGGSEITLDYEEVFPTSSGFVMEGGYSIDVSSIAVGDRVTVTYSVDQDGYKTLGCNGCKVEKQ